MRFTIRDLVWLMGVVGMGCLLLLQNVELNATLRERNTLRSRLDDAKQLASKFADMEMSEVDGKIRVKFPDGWPHTLADEWEQVPGGGAKRKP